VTSPPYTLPPGILKPGGAYKYRIEALSEHKWFEWDNVSSSNQNKTYIVTGPDQARSPHIDLASSGVSTYTQPPPLGTNTWFYIKVHDAQGVPDTIDNVKVLFPDGETQVSLYFDYIDYNESPTCGIYRGAYFGAIQKGTYTFTAVDKEGNMAIKSDYLENKPISYPPEASLVPANNTVIGGTEVGFEWDEAQKAALYEVVLYDKNYNYLFGIKSIENQCMLPPGRLQEESLYRYVIQTRREFQEEDVDNGSENVLYSDVDANTFFTTQKSGTAAAPELSLDTSGVMVWNTPNPATGAPVYMLEFEVKVDDDDGVPENIQKVEVTFPDGTKHLLGYFDNPDWEYNYYGSVVFTNSNSIPKGTYIFEVCDFEGHCHTDTDQLLDETADIEDWIIDWPTGGTPLNDSTVSDTTPTITWNPVTGASYYRVRILRPWRMSTVHWSGEIPSTQTYYTVPSDILETNQTYAYRLYAFREDTGEEMDFYSCNSLAFPANLRFTVPDTPTGSGVEVQPVDNNTGESPVTITFGAIDVGGTTTLTTSEEGATPPVGFMLGDPPMYYEIETTATYSGQIEVCINYSGVIYEGNEEDLVLQHYENGNWEPAAEQYFPGDDIICGIVGSLSAFAVVEPFGGEVEIDIKPGTYPNWINLESKGVVPVAVLSTAQYDATCVDPSTVTFAGASPTHWSVVDVWPYDGKMDMVFQFKTQELILDEGSTEATLIGYTVFNVPIEGADTVQIVPK
jgi:hypothetical protein